ncbi:Clp R domain-containing protein [Candidatus Nitrotoga sp. HW29]|uniref:Clp protease N-terminal domain-containing protein n=1 Tax=Candidatus Nitrotoga sp. HW29 TaxID=2886963 RepID=UPI001EF34D54|nr:Clp protease N-terminal domain-containing protein [Candidatus Nitrotoga sp. HW29]CAH1905619.1 Clp R domain-containing protein [Candidatus Nitrotoga sp. HW29]
MWTLYRADLLGKELETNLRQTIVDARAKRHKALSVEHLLLTMLDNTSAVEILQSRGVNIEELRISLIDFIDKNTLIVPESDGLNTQPTLAFHRIVQSAILDVKSTNKKEATGRDILVFLLNEYDSYAVSLLNQHAIYTLDDNTKKNDNSTVSNGYNNKPSVDPHDIHRAAKNESLLAAGLMPRVSIDETGANLGYYSADLGGDTLAALANAAR